MYFTFKYELQLIGKSPTTYLLGTYQFEISIDMKYFYFQNG